MNSRSSDKLRTSVFAELDRVDDSVLGRLRERQGEVVLVLNDTHHHVWLHTKAFYPDGAFRLPTGGLKHGESPDEGFERELAEETGIRGVSHDCIGVLHYTHDGEKFPFTSYLYIVWDVDDVPIPEDTGEAITGWMPVSRDGLHDHTRSLRALGDGWEAWGEFRALAHDLLIAMMDDATDTYRE